MSKKIVIEMNFNTFNFNKKRLSKEWINQRISIFMNYTRKSLVNQSNQNFISFILFENNTSSLIKNELSKYKPLPENIIFIEKNNYLAEISKHIKRYKQLYLVRLDCDDMYHKSFIQQLHDFKPHKNTIALINQKGYTYDSINNKLAQVIRTSPPFYTLIYNVKEYLNGKRYKVKGGHPNIISLPHEIIKKRNYIITIHSNNTSNNTSNSYKNVSKKDKIKDNNIMKKILADFM